MSQTVIKLDSPFGEFSIPYSEQAILDLMRKIQKVQEGDPNLFEEAVVDFFGLESIEDSASDWLFWEENKVPIYLYDMLEWLKRDFILENEIAYSMSKRKNYMKPS